MENHKEKLAIFDRYAKEQGYKNWNDLLITFKTMEFSNYTFNRHLMNVTDLVQKEALKRASEKVKTVVPGDFSEDLEYLSKEIKAFKQSILSDENLVK